MSLARIHISPKSRFPGAQSVECSTDPNNCVNGGTSAKSWMPNRVVVTSIPTSLQYQPKNIGNAPIQVPPPPDSSLGGVPPDVYDTTDYYAIADWEFDTASYGQWISDESGDWSMPPIRPMLPVPPYADVHDPEYQGQLET